MLRRALPAAFLALAALFANPATAQQNPDFWVVNTSGRTIAEIYVSSTAVTSWGQDRLGQHVLAHGMRFAIRPPRDGTCLFDIRVVYGDGTAEERRRVNACMVAEVVFGASSAAPRAQTPPAAQSPGAVAPGGPNPNFRLVNRSGRVIREIYVSSSAQQTWGPDRLGRDVLGAGQSMVITLPRDGTCVFDIRVVYADGSATERRRVNTCTLSEVTVQ